MKEFHIGEVIKKKRLQLGLSQIELCGGICDISTMSRIETGKQTPAKNKLALLLERLDLPSERYFALVSQQEADIQNLQTEIIFCHARKDPKAGLEKLAALEAIVEEDDHITQQFILRNKAGMGYWENGEIKPYTQEQTLELLYEAIRLTVPGFSIENFEAGRYGVEEIKIINQIGLCYYDMGDNKNAVSIYRPLLHYIKNTFCNLEQAHLLDLLVSYNYGLALYMEKEYEAALEIAQAARRSCIHSNRYTTCFGGVLYLISHSLYKLGRIEECRQYFYQAYYVYMALEDFKDAQMIKDNAAEFGLDITLEC